jgi:tetratricopeptide (TPR) repeat protein
VPPQRPRNHVLETLSRQAFDRIVPPEWVVRPVDEDYGLDREVEIFEGAQATGLSFKVQLKASERTAAAGPSRRIRTDTVGYWKSIDVPVLIVYFAADTGLLYGRWAHTVGREPGFDRDSKTTTVAFSDEEVLTADVVRKRLLEEVEVLRGLRSGRLARPLPLRLAVDDGAVGGLTSTRVAVRLRQAVRERGLDGDVHFLPPQDTGRAVLVSVSAEERAPVLRVALPSDLASLRVTLGEGEYSARDVAGRLTDDVLTAVGFVIEGTGATGPAGRLFAVSAESSSLTSIADVAFACASVMEQEGLARPAARLAMRCWASADPDQRELGDVYYLALLPHLGALTAGDRDEFVDAMERRAAAYADAAPGRAGPAHYNLGKCLNALGRMGEALDAMDAAVTLDRRYTRRGYFFRERGGMRWSAGGFADAAEDYRTALGLGDDPGELLPLLADALLHAGEYAAAQDAVAGWSPTGHDHDRMATILRTAVAELMSVVGLESQDRSAATEVDIDAAGDDPEALIALLRTTDALDPRVWLRLAIDDGRALPRLMLVAQVALNSATGWALACVQALTGPGPPDPALVEAIVASGHGLSDTPFDEAIEEVLSDWQDPDAAEAVRAEVYRLLDRLSVASSPTVVRLLPAEDGTEGGEDDAGAWC